MKRLCLVLLILPLGLAALAQQNPQSRALMQAMQIEQLLSLLHDEGLIYGQKLDEQLLQGRGGADWAHIVAQLYDPALIQNGFEHHFQAGLGDQPLDQMLAFYQSPLGQQIVASELSARRAFLDPETEARSRRHFAEMVQAGEDRVQLLQELVERGDLLDYNLSNTMNARYAFNLGLVQGGAFERDITQEDILRNTWQDQDRIGHDIRQWLFAYLALAYEPLSDAQLRRYIAFCNSGPGRALNRAQFEAYDAVFKQVSQALGLAAAPFLRGKQL
ncbi:MAG: hypothetical protein CSA68_07885 [Rhodobacterales bacterium]|nr:MAG: hypothetical protein CSA68_07885 [Rhodobacterales bacterium]